MSRCCKSTGSRARGYRNPITIEEATLSTDGENTPTWSTYLETHAKREEKPRGERTRGVGQVSVRSTVYTIRYASGITPQMRIVDGSTTRGITDVVDRWNGRQVELELHCLEDGG